MGIDLLDKDIRLQAAGIPTCTPTPEEERYIRDGLAYIVIRSPFFAHLFYNECHLRYSYHIPFAATDAKSIFVNPKGMMEAGWDVHNVAFVLAHEIGHVIFNDLLAAIGFRRDGYVMCKGGQLPYDDETMNIAEDYRINAMLVEAKIGHMPKVGYFDESISAKGMESAIDIYEKIFKRNGGKGPGKKPGNQPGNQPGGHGGFDVHLDPSRAQQKEDPGKRDQAIAAAGEAARAAGQGKLPAAIATMLGEILDPKVSWEDQLKSTCMRHAGDPGYDWRYLDKRLLARDEPMYFARQAHMGAGTVVIGYDTSGSCCSSEMQRRFFSEMAGIVAAINPQELIVIWCDAKVQRVDELEEVEDLEELRAEINALGGAPGGGGTDFRPVFREVEERGLQPDMLVFLTDTYGDFPANEPDYPVIWASIIQKPDVPWGEVVEVEL